MPRKPKGVFRGVSESLPHRRTRSKYKLITDPDEIKAITGRTSWNPLPRCGNCRGIALALRTDHKAKDGGELVGFYCPRCMVIFPNSLVVVSRYGE